MTIITIKKINNEVYELEAQIDCLNHFNYLSDNFKVNRVFITSDGPCDYRMKLKNTDVGYEIDTIERHKCYPINHY